MNAFNVVLKTLRIQKNCQENIQGLGKGKIELTEVMARRKTKDSGRGIKIKTGIEKNIVEGEIFRSGKSM